jgi:hypothetical protein
MTMSTTSGSNTRQRNLLLADTSIALTGCHLASLCAARIVNKSIDDY